MLVLGIITLFLTAFMLIYYGYMARRTDHDVSFFLSVGIISMVMNLCSNGSESARVLAWLYLGIAVVFLALGFAVSVQDTLGFYRSIGTWAKSTFTNTSLIGWQILSFVIAPVGIVLFFVNHRKDRDLADACGKMGMWGLLVWLLVIWMIVGIL